MEFKAWYPLEMLVQSVDGTAMLQGKSSNEQIHNANGLTTLSQLV